MATVTRDDSYQFDEERGFGWLLFAATMLGLAGILSIFDGIAALSKASFYAANAHYVFGSLRSWGWITLVLGALQLLAAAAILATNQLARWFGVVVLGLNAIDQMFFIPAYPFWSLLIIAADIVALWVLCAYGSRENIDAVS